MVYFWIVLAIVIIFFLSGLRVLIEYERAIIFRLGRYKRVSGPGLIYFIPLLESIRKVDLRIKTAEIPRQEVITKDNIPLLANTVVYFKVERPADAVIKIEDFEYAVRQYTQAALRDIVGNSELDFVLTEREKIASSIKKIVDAETSGWGVEIESIKIQELELPAEMKRAMAKQAEAEREKRAVIIAAEGELKASENLKSTKLKKKPIIKSCPISFNRNLFTFSFEKVRIATFVKGKRQNVPIEIPEYYWKYLDWRYQTLEIIKDRKGRLFFHITFSRDINTPISCGNRIMGVDVGINNLAVTSEGVFFKTPKTQIRKFHYLRKRLQSKGTKSAKRLLRKLSGRQKRFMRHYNHVVSKSIVSNADTILMENLKGIRKVTKGKRFNRWLNNWSFYQLQSFVKYKAEREGKIVKFVKPYMTSQTCSSCGLVGSRYYDSFTCLHCGFSLQSDFNASCNLRRLNVTQPNVSVNDTKGQLTTAVDIRDKSPHL